MTSFDNNLNIPTQIGNFMNFGIPNNFNSGTPVLNNQIASNQPVTPVPTTADVYGKLLDIQNSKGIARGFDLSSATQEWSKAVYNDALARGEWTLDHTLQIEKFSLLSKHAEEIKLREATDAEYAVKASAPDSLASGPNA
ncbi:MAG: hypothetical protein ACOYK1_04705 [Vampirovibrionia bacterium]